jgi:hypothetical protein
MLNGLTGRIPRVAGLGVQDLPRAVRQQQILGERERSALGGSNPKK